jgi:hypothetical protein
LWISISKHEPTHLKTRQQPHLKTRIFKSPLAPQNTIGISLENPETV